MIEKLLTGASTQWDFKIDTGYVLVNFYCLTTIINYEMKWIRHNNETTSYNYEMKFIRFHIFMKEFIALLKNEILPVRVFYLVSQVTGACPLV